MTFRIGTDIGGTCTDTTIMDENGQVVIGKELSTYPDFSQGIFNSLRDAIPRLDVEDLNDLLTETSIFLHATTVGENTLFERDGADTVLITTRGFEDTYHQMRGGYGRWSGLSYQDVKDPIYSEMTEPLISSDSIYGIGERASKTGILESLDEDEVRKTIDSFGQGNVDAVACCFLWSHMFPEHEQRVKAIMEESELDVYVTASSDVAPYPGEYERTSTAVVNSYIGPTTRRYLNSLETELSNRGFSGSMHLLASHGGVVTVRDAIQEPVGLCESGPVGGLLGSRFTGNVSGTDSIISTDMGGTTFKVGLIREGNIEYADEPMIGKHHYQFPKKDVHSIPVAGGSIVQLNDENIPQIGPKSQGSAPGPICYGQGGRELTVTDIDLIQGYFSPEYFLGGEYDMQPDKAHKIFEEDVAAPLGKDVSEAAADIYKLVNSMIADLLREVTIEKGIDPRTFTLLAIGGAAGMHATSYAKELDIPRVIIPFTASVHSAFGLLSTDMAHEYSTVNHIEYPFDIEQVNEIFAELESHARDTLQSNGFDSDEIILEKSIDMRYQGQVNEINTPVEFDGDVNADNVGEILNTFVERYEREHGTGSSFPTEAAEIVSFNIRASGPLTTPQLHEFKLDSPPSDHAQIDMKDIYFNQLERSVSTPIYDFDRLNSGNEIDGPAIIQTPTTSIVVDPADEAKVDEHHNVVIDVGGGSE